MAKTVTNYSEWYIGATFQVAQDADRKLRDTGCAAHFLYYKPNGLAFAVVADDAIVPGGFELATPERIPGNMTVDQLTSWIRRHAQSLPVLPGD